MSSVTMLAAAPVEVGQAVRTTGSPTGVIPALDDLHTRPVFGVALQSAAAGGSVDVQTDGAFGGLGPGVPCAVGLNSSGELIRATDPTCVSAPNWIGDCDTAGTVTIRPRRDTRLSVLDFGAAGDGKADDTPALRAALDCAMRITAASEPISDGKVVYMPPGDYRITAPLVVSTGCILEGAGLGVGGTTTIIADVASGVFDLSAATGVGPVGGEVVYCAIALVGYWTGREMSPARGRADWGVLRAFRLRSSPSQGPLASRWYQQPQLDGVRVMAHGPWLERLQVYGFRRNGVTVVASYPPTFTPQINANNTQIRDCILSDNGQDGLYIAGDDSNIMLIMNVDASGNGRDGINDRSFLGCTFVGCHTSANWHRNYNCDRADSPTYSAYVGCYAEGDAPSVFKGNVTVVGGDISVHSDSAFYGFLPASMGPSRIGVHNAFSTVRRYPGQGAGYGLKIDQNELHTPGNGYQYRAISAGRTYGTYRTPKENAPAWPTSTGQTVAEFDGLVWRCEGAYTAPPITHNALGGIGPSIVQDYGYLKPDRTSIPFFRTEVTSLTPVQGRLLTHLTSGVSFHTHFQSTYENGPVPGALMLPNAWVGSYYYGERRIGVAYTGTPFDSTIGSYNFYRPGDLLLNASGLDKRQGATGWTVRASCGRRSAATDWSPGKHYHIGKTVRPTTPNGRVYLLVAYKGGPSYPLHKLSGAQEPLWNPTLGQLTTDNHLEWRTLYDLDDPANAWAIEPIPQRAEAQADSAAIGAAGLRADFNTLLVKMREANLLAPDAGGAPQPAEAMSLTLTQRSLANVDDAAGRLQTEGGEVFQGDQHIGNYASTKRVVIGGTEALNAAMLTLTLFFIGEPGQDIENMTLQGSHDFGSGNEVGSVSAASSGFSSHIGQQFKRVRSALVIE